MFVACERFLDSSGFAVFWLIWAGEPVDYPDDLRSRWILELLSSPSICMMLFWLHEQSRTAQKNRWQA